MSSELARIIGRGNDIVVVKYIGVAATAVLFYEYLVMLPDEVQYARSSNKTWVFYLFLLNRYIPMAFQLWFLTVTYRENISQELCNKASFAPVLAFVTCTLMAQIVLTLRIFAVTSRNRSIATVFVLITASQVAVGIYLIYLTTLDAAEVIPPIPFDSFKLCTFSRHRKIDIAYAGISLTYELLAFLVILRLAGWRTFQQSGIPGLFGTILRDATKYFFVICTAHFILLMTLLFARPEFQLIPSVGSFVCIPVMITRLMISLRKAAGLQGSPWSAGESTVDCGHGREAYTIRFSPMRGVLNRREDSTLLSTI